MNEDQQKAMADLDALWGAGASDSIKACVEATDALIDAAAKQEVPAGLRVPRERIGDATMAVGSVMSCNEHEIPDVNIDIDLQAQVDQPGAAPVFVVYSPGMTQEQVDLAKERLDRHNGLMLAAMLLQGMAKRILTGEID